MPDSEVSRAGDFEKRLASLDSAVKRALLITAKRISLRIIAEHEKARPATIATGQTMRSHTVSPVYVGRDNGGEFFAVRIGPRTTYAFYGIEMGRRAGTPPPLRRIYQWVREKPGGSGMTESELWAVSKTVQKTIAITGTNAYFILSKAADFEIPGFVTILRTSAAAALNGS